MAQVSLNVAGIAKSVEFYHKMFGDALFKRVADYAKFDLANPPLKLTVNQVSFEKGGSPSHFGLQIESTEEMQTDCCQAMPDKA